MEEHGRVVAILPTRSGQSQRTGEVWASQGFVLEVDGRYTRRVRLNLWGPERIAAANLQLGQFITAKFEIEAHESNGEWYNDCRVYEIVCNGVSLLRRNTNQPSANGQQMVQQPLANGQQMVQQGYSQGQPIYQAQPNNQVPAAGTQHPPYLTQEQIMQQQQQQNLPFPPRY